MRTRVKQKNSINAIFKTILTKYWTQHIIFILNLIFMFHSKYLKTMKRLFIFDVDGVLLNLWGPMKDVFEEFTGQKLSQGLWDGVIFDYLKNPAPYMEFGRYFDNSDILTKLPAMPDMPELVQKLKAQGFDLAIVTSVSDKEEIKSKRAQNLLQVFGDVFDKLVCTERGGSKKQALQEVVKGYDQTFFCDDHPKNAALGKGVVTFPLWFQNKYHEPIWEQIDHSGIIPVKNAEDILKLV